MARIARRRGAGGRARTCSSVRLLRLLDGRAPLGIETSMKILRVIWVSWLLLSAA